MFTRLLALPAKPKKSFFLWGPRQTGKTTLLKSLYPEAFRVDLLQNELLLEYLNQPSLLRDRVRVFNADRLIIVDEIQKAPQLLDEIHYLIQEDGRNFGLCGSSARKVRHGHANLLGGRALRYELLGLSAKEIGKKFNLERMLNNGPLPDHYLLDDARASLRGYVDNYLREEILNESLVRRLPIFSDFLRSAALGDTEVINLSNIARECGVTAATVREHYRILEDTLLGVFVPAFTLRQKRRTIQAPKFYFRDVGVVNHLAKRGRVLAGSELFGKAFEHWLFHELSVHSRYSGQWYDISYWRLSSGIEVDFVLGEGRVAIESKGKARISDQDLNGLRQFKNEYPEVQTRILVCLERQLRKSYDNIWIVPYSDFIDKLWQGEWGTE